MRREATRKKEMKMRIRKTTLFLAAAALAATLAADGIDSFTANKTEAAPGDTVNLSIGYTAKKQYELHYKAFDKDGSTNSPDFTAESINSISYKIPDDAKEKVTIRVGLEEGGEEIDHKEMVIEIDTPIGDNLYFCSRMSYTGVEHHPNNSSCFKPREGVEYALIYGDDPGAAIFLTGGKGFYHGSHKYNTLYVGNAIIHFYNMSSDWLEAPTNVLGRSCYSGCCNRTTLGTDRGRICINSRDTEDSIFAKYLRGKIYVRFTGGYYPCSCGGFSNCCGNGRTDRGTVDIVR